MDQNINFEQAISSIADFASTVVSSFQSAESVDAPLFEGEFSEVAENAMEFVSVLGDVASSDDGSIQTLANMAGSVANIISSAINGSDAVSLNDVNNIGSAVKTLAENFAGKLVDESFLSKTGNDEFTNLVKTSLSSNLNSLITEGNINIMGVSISSSGLLNFGIDAFSNMTNASSNILSTVVSGSIDLLNGNKTLQEAVGEIVKTVQNETKALNEKTDKGLDKLAEESGYNREEVEARIGDFVQNSISTFVTSFVTNGIKTAITNPATLSNPVLFLTSTLTATVTSKTFQTKMLSNVSSLLKGEDQKTTKTGNRNELDILDFIKLVASNENVQNMVKSLFASA